MMSALWGRGWLRFLMALLAGAVGVAMTLQAVVVLNLFIDPRDKETGKQIVSFSLPSQKAGPARPRSRWRRCQIWVEREVRPSLSMFPTIRKLTSEPRAVGFWETPTTWP